MARPASQPDPALRRRRTRLGLALIAALLAAGALLVRQAGRVEQPAGPSVPSVPSVPSGSFYSSFEGMQLQDQDGQPLDPARLLGRFVLVNFVFTNCSTACPLQTRALAEMQQQLPPDLRDRVQLLSISLDPLQDTPAALQDFASRMGADQRRWRFATGRPQDIERIAQALRLYRPEPDVQRPQDHSTALWLIDPQGQLRMRYGGNPPDVPRLVRELGALDGLLRSSRP